MKRDALPPAELHWLSPKFGAALLVDSRARAWLENGLAVADVGIDFEELAERIAGGAYRVVMIRVDGDISGAVVLEICWNGNPTKKTLSVIVAGGRDLAAWIYQMQRALREIAAAHECDRVLIAGRPGWERALRDYGWSKTGVILEATPKTYEERAHGL